MFCRRRTDCMFSHTYFAVGIRAQPRSRFSSNDNLNVCADDMGHRLRSGWTRRCHQRGLGLCHAVSRPQVPHQFPRFLVLFITKNTTTRQTTFAALSSSPSSSRCGSHRCQRLTRTGPVYGTNTIFHRQIQRSSRSHAGCCLRSQTSAANSTITDAAKQRLTRPVFFFVSEVVGVADCFVRTTI